MTEAQQDNRAAVAKDVADSLIRAGIGRCYHDATLVSYGEAGIAPEP